MGCVCCSLSSFISIVLDALERISLCTVCALLTCCLMATIITVMVLGIGIGFHYCFVQNSVEAMAKAAEAAGALRSGAGRRSMPYVQGSGGGVMRSVDKAVQRGFAHKLSKRDVDSSPDTNNRTSDVSQIDIKQIGYNSSDFQFRKKLYKIITDVANSTTRYVQ